MSIDYKKLSVPVVVLQRIQESGDAVSFVLQIPKDQEKKFVYLPGQFITVFLDFGDVILPRSYSLCTSPLTDKDIRFTVKKVPGGRGSTYLTDQVKVGDTLWLAPPAGHFYRRPTHFNPTHYVLFAAGSGITPIFSILKTILAASTKDSAELIFANRTESDIIYRLELEALEKKYPSRFKLTHRLSERGERCTPEYISQKLAQSLTSSVEFYMCGPESFMNMLKTSLEELKVSPDLIHQESFASAAPLGTSDLIQDEGTDISGRVYIGEPFAGPKPKSYALKALINGDEVSIENASAEKTLLEILMDAGANPPYSCLEGACMACMAKVREGRVYQNDPGILTDENIEQKDTLTCQAYAASPIVRIDFDNL